MRPLLAIVVTVVILGGMYAYMAARDSFRVAPPVVQQIEASGVFSIELISTAALAHDEFSFDSENEPTLLVALHGQPIFHTKDPLPGGRPLIIKPVEGIVVGKNAFHVDAMVGEDSKVTAHAVRIRIFRDDKELADVTKWSRPGEPVGGEVLINVPAIPDADSHEHG